ncbi:glycosyltransferase family 9 protein [Pseudorhodoplanes sp.]|uniref:glycosyltransferase family 9 protein n=1 Tax=Pseudorhodoplanes sp. TaxID=1934341 RepID=UPI002D070404|nr:glycosyltransferase family 9 protein [Pseudorhodoplanes sp.]HWV54454.1 glycosyltransferase family 9 protein [Pseudorhodoplanes sp.]
MARIDLPERPRILVVALRRLGDVLLTTPLIRSLRRAWPRAHIEALVFADTAPILSGNADIDAVVTAPARGTTAQTLALGRRLWRGYDLAISTQPGDRPTSFAIAAGRRTAGMVDPNLNGRIKAMMLGRPVPSRSDVHRVEETLLLARALGIDSVAEVVVPNGAASILQPAESYAVLHAAPFFRYKQWREDGWRALAGLLSAKGLQLVATGGPGAEERAYLDRVWDGVPIARLDGRLNWTELASLARGAALFAGPDTSVTHLAAAAGCPTVTMYGPTDPRRWGPWPASGLLEPWDTAGDVQRRGNVWLIQCPLPCMPCRLEGCLRKITSHSLCLDQMPIDPVLAAAEEALAAGGAGSVAAKRPLFSQ